MNDIATQVPEQREPDERKRQEARNRANQEFIERLAKRRPGTAAKHATLLEAARAEAPRARRADQSRPQLTARRMLASS